MLQIPRNSSSVCALKYWCKFKVIVFYFKNLLSPLSLTQSVQSIDCKQVSVKNKSLQLNLK